MPHLFVRFIEIPLKRSPGCRAKTKDWAAASHATDMMSARAMLDAQVLLESDPELSPDIEWPSARPATVPG